MKKTVYIPLITILILLIMFCGCTNSPRDNYSYTGESKLWSAEYTFTSTSTSMYECEYSSILSVTYKRDLSELTKVKNLKIEYSDGIHGGSLDANYSSVSPLNQKNISLISEGKGRNLPFPKDVIVSVEVSLDGKEETLELKSVN